MEQIYTGPRGGRYILHNGKKVYLNNSPKRFSPVKRYPNVIYTSSHGQGARTEGWRAKHPKNKKERNMIYDECGSDCFLQPKDKKYVICPRCSSKGNCSCKKSCAALKWAEIRSKHWGAPTVTREAMRQYDMYGCGRL